MQNKKTVVNYTDLENAFRVGGGLIIHFLPYRLGFAGEDRDAAIPTDVLEAVRTLIRWAGVKK